MSTELDCCQQKLEHIIRESGYLNAELTSRRSQITTIRGWCITLILAYLAFLAGSKTSNRILWPAGFAPVGFYIMEALVRMRSLIIQKKIQETNALFMGDPKDFNSAIRNYRFRLNIPKEESKTENRHQFHKALRSKESRLVYCSTVLFVMITNLALNPGSYHGHLIIAVNLAVIVLSPFIIRLVFRLPKENAPSQV